MKEIVNKAPKNKAFIKRFKQEVALKRLNPDFKEEVVRIRKALSIPSNGFASFRDEDFLKWIDKQTRDEFKLINLVFKSSQIIKCKPKHFLNKIIFCLENAGETDDYPVNLYFLESIKTFNNLIQEKPFPGILHFVIFNEVFIPESNELLLTIDSTYNNPILVLGPNATMRDIQEFFPIINFMQKSFFKGFKKNRTRTKKNFIVAQNILKEHLTAYEIADLLHLPDKRSLAKKSLAQSRQIKKRAKKYAAG